MILVPQRDSIIHRIMLFCEIKPHPRPRINKHTGSIYQPRETMQELLNELHIQYKTKKKPYLQHPFILDAYINFDKPPRTKEKHPVAKKYGDEDNLRKSIMDALQLMEIIDDDKLCVGGMTYKAFGQENCAYLEFFSVKNDLTVYP